MNFQDSADIQRLAAMDTPLHIGVTPRYVRKQQTPATNNSSISNNATPAMNFVAKTPKTPKVAARVFLKIFLPTVENFSVTLVFIDLSFAFREFFCLSALLTVFCLHVCNFRLPNSIEHVFFRLYRFFCEIFFEKKKHFRAFVSYLNCLSFTNSHCVFGRCASVRVETDLFRIAAL